MNKILATCENNQVTVQGATISATILGAGVEKSEGALLIDQGQVTYIPNTTPDISELIDLLVATLNQIVTISTGLDGATNAPGAQASAIAQLASNISELQAKKEKLR